jgi:hypothetical protein
LVRLLKRNLGKELVEYRLPVNPKERLLYVPKVLCEQFGYELKLTPSTKAMLLYSKDTTVKELLASLKHLQYHFAMLESR